MHPGLGFVFLNGSCSAGQLLEAAEHYEAFHQLTQGRVWKDETGRVLNLLACESLLRTYRILADEMLESQDYKQAIKILIKASEIAKEGKWKSTLSHWLPLMGRHCFSPGRHKHCQVFG